MKSSRNERRGGYTLLEMMIALALVAALMGKVAILIDNAHDTLSRDEEVLTVEDQARAVLSKISLAVLSCDRRALNPILSPEHSSGVRYQVSMGFEDGDVIWSDQEEIAFAMADGAITWRENPDMPDERRVIWVRSVQQLLEGEVVNGIDDNGNGLVDEEGLNFVIDGNLVTIRISLGVEIQNGERITRSVESTVSCRNHPIDS